MLTDFFLYDIRYTYIHYNFSEKMQVLFGGKNHYVNHFNYTAWPDHGVPEDTTDLAKMIKHIDCNFTEGKQMFLENL